MLKTCPNPVDVQDIQFKLHCRLKIFDNKDLETFPRSHSLISCASRYGLLFAGTNTPNLQVINLKCVENYSPKDKDITNYPRRNIALPSVATHICVNCDSTVVAVVVNQDKCPTVIFYDVLSFYKQQISVIKEVRLSATPDTYVTEIGWNPALPGIFTACKSNGALGVYEIKGNAVDINELPPAAEATCFCWSPKGKQIAVGSKRGQIIQYKPDLKPVKIINQPPTEGQHSLISLQWISNYQFIGIYKSPEIDSQAKLIVVDAPKIGDPSYINYDDVCYSGTSRHCQFYMNLQQQWTLLMIASSNSTELGVLGNTSDCWTQWIVPDAARAELPLSSDKQETLPVGLTIDISPTKELPWGEGTIPPCPYLIIISHHGVLCFFNMVNLKVGAPNICTPPDNITDMSGIGQFVSESVKVEEKKITALLPNPPISIISAQLSTPTTMAMSQNTDVTSTTPETNSTASVFPKFTDNVSKTTAPQVTTASTSFFGQSTSDTAQPFSFGQTDKLKASLTSQGPLFGQSSLATTPTAQSVGENSVVKPSLSFGHTQPVASTLWSTPISQPQKEVDTKLSFNVKTTQSQSLFGGQTSITPVKPQASRAPLFSNQVVTTTASKDPSDKYDSIFTALNRPTIKPVSTAKTVVISTPKVEDKSTSVPPKASADLKRVQDNKSETDALLTRMIRKECLSLESELKTILQQGRSINVNIGTDVEKRHMVSDIEALQEFIKEIVDVSLGENAEVHSLKQNLILSWAWYEEALSRYNSSKDETMMLLLKSQPLDPVAEKRQSDIKRLFYYIESQLSQASKALDEQWDNFQDYAKKTYRVQMPTMETIFQAMVRQNAVLQKQSYIMKDISSRLKHKAHSLDGPPLLLQIENTTDLEEELKRLQINPESNQKHFYEKAIRHAKCLTKSKSGKLRNVLKNREVTHVACIKPQLSSTFQSPAGRSKMASILGAQMSPVQKPSAVRSLEFTQSTPIRDPKTEMKPIKAPPNTPALKETATAAFSFRSLEKSNSASTITTTSGFQPLAKSASVFSNIGQGSNQSLQLNKPSAFVPTTQSSKLFNFTSPSDKSSPSVPSFGTKTIESSSIPVARTTPHLFNFSSGGANNSLSVSTTTVATKPINFGTIFSFNTVTTSASVDSTKTSSFGTATTKPSSFSGPSATAAAFGNTSSTLTTPTSKPLMFGVPTTSQTSVSNSGPSLFTVKPVQLVVSHTASLSSDRKSVDVSKPALLSTPSSLPTFGTITSSTSMFSTGTTSAFTTVATSPITIPKFGTTVAGTTTKAENISSPTTMVSAPFSFISLDPTTSSTSNITVTPPITTSTVAVGLSSGITVTSSSTPAIMSTLPLSEVNVTVTSSNDITVTTTPSSGITVVTTPSSGITVTTTDVPVIDSTSKVDTPTTTSAAPLLPSFVSSSIFGVSSTTSLTPVLNSGTTTASSFSSVPTTSVAPSIFGSVPTTSASPAIFGTATSNAASIFGSTIAATASSTTPPVFGSSTGTSTFSSENTTKPSSFIFASGNVPVTTSSVFGSMAVTDNTTTSSSKPAAFASSASIFGSTPVSTTTGSTSIFASPSTITSSASIFGSATPSFGTVTSSSQTPTFGSSTAQSPIFGSTTTSTTSTVFGSTSATSAQSPAFATNSATTQGSIFAGATTQAPVFGTPSTTQSSIFGTPTTATSPFGGGFASTMTGSPFGQMGSIFATPTTTAGTFGSPFGGNSTFGSTPTTTASVFGQPATFGQSTGSVFGTPTTSNNIFGGNSTTPTFGTTSSSGNVFGSPAASSFSFANAGNTGATNSFGFGGLNVGNTATSPNVFGGGTTFGQSTVANPFSRTEQKTSFVASGGSIFGSPSSSTSGSIFGSNTGSTFGNTSQPVFGASTFGQQQSSPFGQPSAFSNTSPPQGPFSSGGTGVGQTGFGSPSTFQKSTSGFGAPPVFGGSPQTAFGARPTFGGSPAFGAAPTFGSPTKVFGSNTATAAFGSTSTGSTGFGNLANQNTIGFGNLAQQAATSTPSPFSGNSSFSSWR